MKFEPDEIAALARAVALELRKEAAASTPSQPAGEEAQFITRREVRTRFKIDVKTLSAAERSGALESFKPGKRVLFRAADVARFVESHKVAPASVSTAIRSTADVIELDAFERARAARRGA